MPEFMVLIHESEAAGATLAPGETRHFLVRQAAYEQELRTLAAFVDGERLRPSAEARRVSRDETDASRIEAGPFREPTLGAYYVLQAADLDAALQLAGQCPIPPGAQVEVRPVMSGHFEPDKTSQRGRVFAFAVLGTAPNERSWIDAMDRIDERTRGLFPEHQFCGGARLEAPSRGRHISSAGGRRATFDGPFLEGKEVIGGLFFMRMASLDEAVEWASGSAFLEHGALENPGAVAELSTTIADIVRREKSRVVAALVRRLGSIDAAEEAFQEAVLAALPSWRDGLPTNPAAWLTTAAKNHARDAARHQRIVDTKSALLSEHDMALPEPLDSFGDEQLRLIFTCCHPALTLDSQVALTLKVVAGLTSDEIARAFLCPEKTISQRITRAKKAIEERQLPFEVPERLELPERLAPVLTVVYLIFNEGHTTRQGSLMRLDLQTEALRLARLLCDLVPNESEVFGLFALIALSLARAETRTDEHGDPVLLSEQDRSRWDRRAIKEGLLALQRARRLGGAGAYAVQAEISACHATAATWADTEWARILRLYDELRALAPSPIVALNRAVAVCMHNGPAAGLEALSELEAALSSYHLFFALRADFRSRSGQNARDDYQRALALASNDSELRFLRRKIDQLS